MDDRTTRRLINILYKIIHESEDLLMFKNSITRGRVTSNGAYVITSKIKLKSINNSSSAIDDVWNKDYGFSVIRIADFSPRDISFRSLYTGERETDDSRYFYSNLYGKYWKEDMLSSRIGINVLKRVKIKGYMLNFNDIRRLIHDSFTIRRYENLMDYINEFYYMGNRNCLLGINSSNGILFIRNQALIKLLEYNDDDIVKNCLRNMLQCFCKFYEKFMELNISNYKGEIAEIVEGSTLNRLINNEKFSGRYHRIVNNSDPEGFMRIIKQFIKDKISGSVDNTIFGATDSQSYANLLNQIIQNRRSSEKEIFKNGFAKGMRIGLKFEMLGWSPTIESNFADEKDDQSIWWEKEVDIKPDTFIHQHKRYLIPEKERCFQIRKLYINQDGKMRCDGDHPNISGSTVCMGDLKVSFSDEISDIQEVLFRVETLLDVINFDSSYSSTKLDHLVKVSTPADVLDDVNSSTKIKKSQKIRELDSDFDDSDDEEEIIEENEVMVLVDEEGRPIAEQFVIKLSADDLKAANKHDREKDVKDHKNLERVKKLEIQSINYIGDAEILKDISIVGENGGNRPAVYIMGNGSEQPEQETLVLGDGNLIRGR